MIKKPSGLQEHLQE